MKRHRSKFIKTAAALICFLGIIAAARLWYLEEQGNFHPITPDEAYRSAQLDQDELKHDIRKFKIRSVINLTGKEVGEPLYEEEIAICRDMKVRHYDLGLSAGKTPSSHEIEKLLKLFRIAPRPVLIHCRAGADRSGLAAALWKVVIDEAPKSVAREQLCRRSINEFEGLVIYSLCLRWLQSVVPFQVNVHYALFRFGLLDDPVLNLF